MEEELTAEDVAGKVKMVYFNNPNKIIYVTKDAVPLVFPKWIPAEDQTAPAPKKVSAAPAANEDQQQRFEQLRAKYAELGGNDPAVNAWSIPLLQVKIAMLEKMAAVAAQNAPAPEKTPEPAAETILPPVSETAPEKEPKAKRPYNKKPKAETQPA